RLVARLGGREREAVRTGRRARDDVADMLKGELSLLELVRGEVDGAQRVEHRLLVTAELPGLLAVLDRALEVLELEAGASDVEVAHRVLVVDADERLEVPARGLPVVLSGGDHRKPKERLGERARLLVLADHNSPLIRFASLVHPVELEERLSLEDE